MGAADTQGDALGYPIPPPWGFGAGLPPTTIDAIISGARTGEIGDGKIFILDLAECIRIRTGERGGEAIG